MIFGDSSKFAIDVEGVSAELVSANFFIAGQNITPVDNSHYDQLFIDGGLMRDAEFLINNVNWFKYDDEMNGEIVADKFMGLFKSDIHGWTDILSWMPSGNGYLKAIVPHLDKLYLCCSKSDNVERVYGFEFVPYDIVNIMFNARKYVIEESKNPYLTG